MLHKPPSLQTDAYGVVAQYCVKIKKKLGVEDQQEAMEGESEDINDGPVTYEEPESDTDSSDSSSDDSNSSVDSGSESSDSESDSECGNSESDSDPELSAGEKISRYALRSMY